MAAYMYVRNNWAVSQLGIEAPTESRESDVVTITPPLPNNGLGSKYNTLHIKRD